MFRVLLASPTLADRVRISVLQPVPGQYFSINELRLYEGGQRTVTALVVDRVWPTTARAIPADHFM